MSFKRFLLPAATACVALALLAAGIELVATLAVYARDGRYVPAQTRFASKTNTFVGAISGGDCGYVDTMYPHPYLGFVHHGNPPCGDPAINNIGLFGPDFPSRRPDDRFAILVTGGSVAAQFAMPVATQPAYLEQILNARYLSPTGMPFLVLDGGDGAWKQPQQAILAMLYADAVHAIVTLDGFNEHYQLNSYRRFEYPANNFVSVNPLATEHFGTLITRWAVGRARSKLADNPLLSRSTAAYEVVALLERWAERRAASAAAPTTTLDTLFAVPRDWTLRELRTWQLGQYRKYLRAISGIARDHGTLAAHFIQPVPAVSKPLTPEERTVVGDLSYGESYRDMTSELLKLNDSGIPVISLLRVFDGDRRTLYSDPIHLVRDGEQRSVGYERMAAQMADDLARLWGLRRR